MFGNKKLLIQILGKVNQMALDLTALTAAVAQETSVDTSAITLLKALTAEIASISASSTDAATQTALNALVTTANANAAGLAAAVTANTPVATSTQS